MGAGSLAVTLPSDWARSVGLSAGDSVSFLQADTKSLMIVPTAVEESERRRAVLQVPRKATPAYVERLLIGCYVAGFDEIEVRSEGPMDAEFLDGLRNAISRLTGFVAVATEDNALVARSYLGASQDSIEELVHRLTGIAQATVARAPAMVGSRDVKAAREVVALGEQADRLYYLILRQVLSSFSGRNPTVPPGPSSLQDAVGYRLVAKALEEICDSMEALADMILRTEGGDWGLDPSLTNRASAFADRMRGLLGTVIDALFDSDAAGAERVLGEVVEMEREKEHFLHAVLRMVHTPLGAAAMGVAAVNLRDVCRFTRVVAEVALNHALRQNAGNFAHTIASVPEPLGS